MISEPKQQRDETRSSSNVAFCRDLLAGKPDEASLWLALAEALLAEQRHDEALAAVQTALILEPDYACAWLLRGSVNLSLRQFAAAADALANADRLMPDRRALLLSLATCHVELRQFAAAEECLARVIDRHPGCAEAYANLSSVHVRQGRFDQAEIAARRALTLAPGMMVAHQNLAGILARSRPAEAAAHRDEAYRSQRIFIDPAVRPRHRVLVLSGADAANVPLQELLPRQSCTRIDWYIEYAPPGEATRLPAYDLVVNAIGDPDLAAAAALPLARFLAKCDRPLINHPARVARTHRHELPALLEGIPDIAIPRVLRLSPGQIVASRARDAGLNVPLILRRAGSHGGDDVHLVRDAAALAVLPAASEDSYATEFVDYQGSDRLYRKFRAIFVDRVPYAYHLAISTRWLVHYWTSDMERSAAHRAEERRFLDDPSAAIGARAMRALALIGARLDLDYAGIDFTILPDGTLLVFEANATMLVHSEDAGVFSYKNPAVQRIRDAFGRMLEGINPI